ncbi:ABC transporter, permease protein [Lachnospiraceae bacterium KM106-2]|nr:ABC transporter, permease protein [Lachnospiraceae bacterium KM106-2]
MRKSRELVWYHMHLYFKTNKWVMPFLVWILSLVVSYSVKPVHVGSSILVSAGISFFISLWLGITYYDNVDPVAEQITILKVQNRRLYDISQFLFLGVIASLLSTTGVLFPSIKNVTDGLDLYTRTLHVFDMICSLWIHLVLSFLGIGLSMLFQPRIMKNRKFAILLMACISVLAISKSGMIDSAPPLKGLLWVLPPLSDILTMLGNKDYFYVGELCKMTGYSVLYLVVLFVISEVILQKKNNY